MLGCDTLESCRFREASRSAVRTACKQREGTYYHMSPARNRTGLRMGPDTSDNANGYFLDIWDLISVFCLVGSDVKTGPGYGDWGTDGIRGCREPSSAVI